MTALATFAKALSVCALMAAAGTAQAQSLTTTRVATGLVRPVFVCAPPGDTGRLFIVEQRGSGGTATRADIRIMNLSNNSINATPFLSITGVATGSEQGLLGLAFAPDYTTSGNFFVYYTISGGSTVVARYTANGTPATATTANAASAVTVLTQAQPFSNHNGGWIGFGPDNYLYIAMGDGGNFCDSPNGNAQNRSTLLGKMLRIDVSSLPYTIPATNPFFGQAGIRGEIWSYGLRNPWRCSFDRQTGEMYIGDVGQDVQEEVNVEPSLTGGRNYGWNCREGFVCSTTSPSSCSPSAAICPGCVLGGATDPVWAYNQAATSNCSVTGGYVYRGCAIPSLRGTYFFADVCSNQIWSFAYAGVQVPSVTNRTAELAVAGFTINSVVSFGEDGSGELYIVDQGGGELYRIIPRCYANCDGSTSSPVLNVQDFSCFLNSFASGDCYANCDGSTAAPVLNIQDFACFLNSFASGTCP
jgi:glucose/arabinose dehydrogenase